MPVQAITVCKSDDLPEGRHLIVDVEYRGRPGSVIVLRFEGRAYAYLNKCVHMDRRLDCEHGAVFDPYNRFLRCSMHGIAYQPETGESLSEICLGKRLTALRLHEGQGRIVLLQKGLVAIDQAS